MRESPGSSAAADHPDREPESSAALSSPAETASSLRHSPFPGRNHPGRKIVRERRQTAGIGFLYPPRSTTAGTITQAPACHRPFFFRASSITSHHLPPGKQTLLMTVTFMMTADTSAGFQVALQITLKIFRNQPAGSQNHVNVPFLEKRHRMAAHASGDDGCGTQSRQKIGKDSRRMGRRVDSDILETSFPSSAVTRTNCLQWPKCSSTVTPSLLGNAISFFIFQ